MQNLFTALSYRLGSGDVDDSDIQEIAAALDAAALAIERKG
jgi:hypothetical protein